MRSTLTHIVRGIPFLALVVAPGCGEVRDLRWVYDVGGDGLPGVTGVQARIRRGGCLGDVEWEAQWVRGEPGAMPPELGHGQTWGFEVRLIDDMCQVRGTGCRDVSLPSNMTVVTEVAVQPAPFAPACNGMQVCSAGRCIDGMPDDGGMECEGCCPEDTCGSDGVCIPPSEVTSIMGGTSHSCAIRGGELFCWGTSTIGEIGNGSMTGVSDSPVRIATETDWSRVDGQARTTCAISDSGEVRCWGSNSAGQLGIGSSVAGMPTPQRINSAFSFSDMSVGNEHACAVTTGSRIQCWGRNDELAVSGTGPATITVPTPYDDGLAFGVIELGGRFSCGFAGGLLCWGDDSYATMARGEPFPPTPIPVLIPGTFRAFGGGNFHACAIDSANQLGCWGKNLADGASNSEFATGVPDDGVIVATPFLIDGVFANDVDASNHTCALTTEGQIVCFGPNRRGQLGNGNMTSTPVPQRLEPPREGGGGWTLVRLGQQHSCAADRAGGLWCWGANDMLQLGVGGSEDRLVPTRVCFGE